MSRSIAEKLQRFAGDPRSYAWVVADRLNATCERSLCSALARFLLRARGIELGAGCRFYGMPVARRAPHSTIRVGQGCTFRSSRSANLVGLDRGCILGSYAEGAEIDIGARVGFSGTVVGARQHIIIGDDALCGANTLVTDFDWHGLAPGERRGSPGASAPVRIGHNVWLGVNVVVLKGVTIGENTVIGANSVVVKDIPGNVIAAGNPCRPIRPLE